jgi:hypothetical protein
VVLRLATLALSLTLARYKVVLRLSLIAGFWLFSRFLVACTQHAASALLWCHTLALALALALALPLALALALALPLALALALALPLALALALALGLGLSLSPSLSPSPPMHQALRVVVEDDDDDQHDGRQAAGSKVPPLGRQPSSAPHAS